MVCQERRQQGHGHEEDHDGEAHHALPVGLVEAPDLTRVPDGELGALGVRGPPCVHAGGDEHDHDGLVQPGGVRVAARDRELPVEQTAGRDEPGGRRGAGGEQQPGLRRGPGLTHQLGSAEGEQRDGQDQGDQRRVVAHGRREEAREDRGGAARERTVLGVGDQREDEPGDRRPDEDPGAQAARDHAFTRGSR